MSLIIGLTGGIGSGKSTVALFFKALHIDVIDADVVARTVVEKGQPVLTEISHYFGSDILDNGHLNRTKLRGIIFANEQKKKWLNNLLHPLIRLEILAQLERASSEYVLLEAPLLFENKLDDYCDYVVVVDIHEQFQIERASARDNTSHAQIEVIIKSQINRKLRIEKADFVIDNNAVSRAELESSVIALDKRLRALQ